MHSTQPGGRARSAAVIGISIMALVLNTVLVLANLGRGSDIGYFSRYFLPLYLGAFASLIGVAGAVSYLRRAPRAAAGLFISAAVVFVWSLPLGDFDTSDDKTWLWWPTFSVACLFAAWLVHNDRPPVVATESNIEEWQRSLKLITRLSWVLALTAVVVNWLVMLSAGIVPAFIWTLAYIGAGFFVLKSIRTNRMRKCGLSPQEVRNLARGHRAERRGGPGE